MLIIYINYGKTFYNLSFNEGNISNTLEVVSSKKIELIEESDNLANSLNDNENKIFTYRLHFNNKESLESFKKKLSDQSIKKINVVYN